MAIKRTIGRSKFVQPTGIVPDSGGLAMAQASQNIANAVASITDTIDKNQLETAIIEAEKQGKQVGSRSVDGVPVPLDQMSLNSFTSDIYNQNSLRKAQSYFKKQAINSYGLALQNHAVDTASMSLQENLGKLDANGNLVVKEASKGYISSLKDKLSPEVFAEISPGINKIWGNASRKASAYMLDNVKKVNMNNAEKSLNHLLEYESNFIINGSADESDYLYIDEAKKKAFEIIDDNSTDATQASTLKLQYKTGLETRVATNTITMAHASGMSISDLMSMTVDTVDSLKLDQNINGEVVGNSMMKEIQKLNTIDTKSKQESKKSSVDKANTLTLNLMNNDVIPSQNEIEELNIEEQITMGSRIDAHIKTKTIQTKKLHNDNILKIVADIAGNNINIPENKDKTDFSDGVAVLKNREKMNLVSDLITKLGSNLTSNQSRIQILKLSNGIADGLATQKSDIFKANIEIMMSGNTDAPLNPKYLRSEDYIRILVNKGLIGTSKENAYTREQWIKRVNTYETAFIKKNQEAKIYSEISYKIKKRLPINEQDRTALEKIQKTSFELDGVNVEYDVLHDNQIIREESIKHYTSIALSTQVLPKKIIDVLNNIGSLNDTNFMYAKLAYASIKQAVYKAHENDNPDSAWESFSNDNLNDLDTLKLDDAKHYGDASVFRSAHSASSADRKLSEIFPKKGFSDIDGNLKNDAVMFKESLDRVGKNLDNNWFLQLFTSNIGGSLQEDATVRKWFAQNNVDNMADLFIKDPILKSNLIRFVKYQAMNGKLNTNTPELALDAAVKKAIYKFSSHLHMQEDEEGRVHLVDGISIMKHAQSQIPGDGYEISKNELINDALSQYNATFGGGSSDPSIREAIDNKNIIFVPNKESAGDQTFRVVALTKDGRAETIANHYSWSWDNSQQNEDYEEAKLKISNDGVRKLLNSFDFMAKSNLVATMESIKSNRDQAQTWTGIVNTYNQIASSIKSTGITTNDVLPYINSQEGQKELQEYFDSKRFFRLDLR